MCTHEQQAARRDAEINPGPVSCLPRQEFWGPHRELMLGHANLHSGRRFRTEFFFPRYTRRKHIRSHR